MGATPHPEARVAPMALSDAAIRKIELTGKTQRLFDGLGMYLEVSPAGGRWWCLKYRFLGKGRLSLGTYPDEQAEQMRFSLYSLRDRLSYAEFLLEEMRRLMRLLVSGAVPRPEGAVLISLKSTNVEPRFDPTHLRQR